MGTVTAAKCLIEIKKQDLKKKRTKKTMKALKDCQMHCGPVEPTNIDILQHLNEKELFQEITYLRLTVSIDITQKRLINLGNGQYKYQNSIADKLKASIKKVKPENKISSNTEELLKKFV